MKTALVFPGQGSQYLKMGEDFYNNYSAYKNLIDKIDATTDCDFLKNIYDEDGNINDPKVTQFAIFSMSVGITNIINELGINFNAVAGFSLGEYAAYSAKKVVTNDDLIKILNERANLVIAKVDRGGMFAVTNLDFPEVSKVCEKISAETGKIVEAVNYNSPVQTVIAGDIATIEANLEQFTTAGAKRVIKLNVAAAFHSSY